MESTKELLATNSKREVNDFKRLSAYKYEIQKTRDERDKKMKTQKTLVEKIIATWKDIKELRNKNGFRSTEIKLIIKKFVIFYCFLEFFFYFLKIVKK